MRFPKLNYEKLVQIADKTRLDANQSFWSNTETIQNIEIEPDTSAGFISVYNVDDPYNRDSEWYLDWAYETDGTKTISVRVTTDAGASTKSYDMEVLSETDDALFSNDNDLYPYEPTISRYLPEGKSSFLYAHRAAQSKIIAYLDEHRIWKKDGTRFTKADLVDKEEFKYWSIFQTLLIIFESSQLTVGDIFEEKRQQYGADMVAARNRGSLRLDYDGDGEIDQTSEKLNTMTTRLVRR